MPHHILSIYMTLWLQLVAVHFGPPRFLHAFPTTSQCSCEIWNLFTLFAYFVVLSPGHLPLCCLWLHMTFWIEQRGWATFRSPTFVCSHKDQLYACSLKAKHKMAVYWSFINQLQLACFTIKVTVRVSNPDIARITSVLQSLHYVHWMSTPTHWMRYLLLSWANNYMLAEIRLSCTTISCLASQLVVQ